MSSRIEKSTLVWGGSVLAVIITVIGVYGFMWGGQTLRMFLVQGRWWLWFFGAIVLAIVILSSLVAADDYSHSYNSSAAEIAKARTFKIVGVVVSLGLLAGAVIPMFSVSYGISKAYTSSVSVERDIVNESISFEQRAPYEVASNSAKRTMQDVIGEPQAVKSVPDLGENGAWNTLIVRPGIGVGYEAIQTVDVPLFGSVTNKNVQFCEFDERASLRLGGVLPQNNLARAVFNKVPLNVTLDYSDAYGYCDDETPVVVMPLKRTVGFHALHDTAYGVATYNGKTGEIKVLTDVKDTAEVPGATYPNSVAVSQRIAFTATGSFADHWFSRIGWVAADSRNSTEVKLMKNGEISLVSPLNSVGSSSTVVGVSTIDGRFTGKALNPITVNLYKKSETRKAMSSLAESVETSYANLTDWATGLQVFEIVPGEAGTWVASLGKEQSVLYRAEISADETIILRDANGNIVKNNSRGEANSETGGEAVIQLPAGTDLTSMSKEELKTLIQNAVDELAAR